MQTIFRQIKHKILFFKNTKPDFPAHVHDDIELVYTKHGHGTAYCDGKKYALTDGTWFLAFPNQVHHYVECVDGEYWVLIMKPSYLLRYGEMFLRGVPNSAVHCFENLEDDGLGYLLETACREYERYGYSDVISAYLTVILGKLLPFFPVEKTSYHMDTTLKILQYCTAHYKEDLTVASVAESLGLSRSCVSHIFSTRICMNFCDYINSLRLTEAEMILKNKNYTITEAANMSGFPTIRTFNRVFLKKHGFSPFVYQKMLGK